MYLRKAGGGKGLAMGITMLKMLKEPDSLNYIDVFIYICIFILIGNTWAMMGVINKATFWQGINNRYQIESNLSVRPSKI